jgi:hypothetical protein
VNLREPDVPQQEIMKFLFTDLMSTVDQIRELQEIMRTTGKEVIRTEELMEGLQTGNKIQMYRIVITQESTGHIRTGVIKEQKDNSSRVRMIRE